MVAHSNLQRFSNHDDEIVQIISFKIKLCFVNNKVDDDENEDDDDDQATW